MDGHRSDRRDFLKQAIAIGAVGVIAGARPGLGHAGTGPERSGTKMSYDPAAKFELKVSEVEFWRTPAGRQLMARI